MNRLRSAFLLMAMFAGATSWHITDGRSAIVEVSFTATPSSWSDELLGIDDPGSVNVSFLYDSTVADILPGNVIAGVYPQAHLSSIIQIGAHTINYSFGTGDFAFSISDSPSGDSWVIVDSGGGDATLSGGPLIGTTLDYAQITMQFVDVHGSVFSSELLPSTFPTTGWDAAIFQIVGSHSGALFNIISDIDLGSISSESVAEVPLPAALPLLAASVGFMTLFGWRRKDQMDSLVGRETASRGETVGWSHYASACDLMAEHNPAYAEMRSRFRIYAAMLPREPAKVIDIGCGTGTFSLLAAARFKSAEVIGIDLDPVMLDIAREKAPQRLLGGLAALGLFGRLRRTVSA